MLFKCRIFYLTIILFVSLSDSFSNARDRINEPDEGITGQERSKIVDRTGDTDLSDVLNGISSDKTADEIKQMPAYKGMKLVWSDEFNEDGAPDSTRWGYNLGTGDGGWGNSELQYYTRRPENVIIKGGVLRIMALKENYHGSAYTSARLLSKNKFDFKYGKVEVSAKLPEGTGTWPAIWMLGSNAGSAGWPACGEIDIMEYRGREVNKIFGTLHYPGRSGGNADGGTKMISNASSRFHKYSLEWSPASIKIFVDDLLYHTVGNSDALPFNHNFFLILNLAVGGTFGGAVDPGFTGAAMEVDYIRVYQ